MLRTRPGTAPAAGIIPLNLAGFVLNKSKSYLQFSYHLAQFGK
jgi:hypothetical protein